MADYRFKATRLIVLALEKHELKFRVEEYERQENIEVGFYVKGGPSERIEYISTDDDNDVAVRLCSLVNDVPKERLVAMLKACNELNTQYRFVKFCIDKDNDLNVECDFPQSSGDDCLGEMAVELFHRTATIVTEGYPTLMKALYLDDDKNEAVAEKKDDNYAELLRSIAQKDAASLENDEDDDENEEENEDENED